MRWWFGGDREVSAGVRVGPIMTPTTARRFLRTRDKPLPDAHPDERVEVQGRPEVCGAALDGPDGLELPQQSRLVHSFKWWWF